MNLNQAVSMGVVLDDVKECAACHFTPEGFTTFRGIGRCVCGTPVLLHIEGVWRNGNPVLLHVRVGGEHCPDCGSALTPTVVTWAGIYSPGAPFIPATTISTNDVCNALALLELEGHR
jgi:hypothetical protein